MRANKLVIFLIVLLVSMRAGAQVPNNHIAFTCEADGVLNLVTENAQGRRIYLTKTLMKTADSAKTKAEREKLLRKIQGLPAAVPAKSDTISLKYPLQGPNSNRTSPSYIRKEIEHTVEVALEEGVDPFYAIAVSILENPPLQTSYAAYSEYRQKKGSPPVEGITLARALGCFTTEKPEGIKHTDANVAGYLKREGVSKLPALTTSGQSKYMCSPKATLKHGGSLELRYYDEPTGYCCTQFKSNADLSQSENKNIIADHYGMHFMRNHVLKQIEKDKADGKSLTYSLQRFNGIGYLGCTEEVSNNCLDGLHMGDRPVYGAQAADIMINMLMTNSEIAEIVLAKQRALKAEVKSVFCLEKGRGYHTVDKNAYWLEQYKYLLGGNDGAYRTRVCYNGERTEDPQIYKKVEARRQRKCSEDFMSKTTIRSPQAPENPPQKSKATQ